MPNKFLAHWVHHSGHHPYLAYYQPGYDEIEAGRLPNRRHQDEFSHISVRTHLSNLLNTTVAGVVNASDTGHTRRDAILSVLPTVVKEMHMIPWPAATVRATLRKRAITYTHTDPAACAALQDMLLRLQTARSRGAGQFVHGPGDSS